MTINAQCKVAGKFVNCDIVKNNALTFLVRLKDGNIIKRRKALVHDLVFTDAKPGLLKRLKRAVIG